MTFRTANPIGHRTKFAIEWTGLLVICLCLVTARSVIADEPMRCDDALFLRRASVVLTGRTPSRTQIEGFRKSDDHLDRERLVDEILGSENYGESWGRWLAILTGCEEEPLSTAAFAMKVPRERMFWLWQTWTQEKLNHDKPFTEIIHELIASDSRSEDESYREYLLRYNALVSALKNDFEEGGFSEDGNNDLFWKTNRSPEQNAELIARNLLGFRLDCAKCHDHPHTHWTMDDHTAFCSVFQRTVYAELPFRTSEKYSLLIGAAVTGATLSFGLFCGSIWLLAKSRTKPAFATNVLSAMSVALGCYVANSFRHVLFGTTGGKPIELATRIAETIPSTELFPTLVAMVLLVGAYIAATSFRNSCKKKPINTLIKNFACFVIISFASLLTIDVAFVSMGGPKGNDRTLLSAAKRELFQVLDLGGQGQQIREVYDDTNGNFHRLGTPKAIDGPQLNDAADSHPRREFADWLICEPTHQLERNLVNRVAQRVFGVPFVEPADDYRPDSVPADKEYFEVLVDGFRSHNHSLKWLLKELVLSERFQTHPDVTAEGISFRPRALRGEEIVASLNQLTSSKIQLADKWSPHPDNPFTCGTEAPNWNHLGDRILNAAQCADSDMDVPFEIVSILMMDGAFQQHLNLMAAELMSEMGSMQTAIELATECLWRHSANDEQKRLLIAASEQQPLDFLWCIINSPQFLILD